jgi:hypothetical protein
MRSFLVQVRSYNFTSLGTADDRHNLEGRSRTSPLKDPFLKESEVITLHQLKTATEVRFDPAVNVLQTVRKHSTGLANASIDGDHVVIAKALDHHE